MRVCGRGRCGFEGGFVFYGVCLVRGTGFRSVSGSLTGSNRRFYLSAIRPTSGPFDVSCATFKYTYTKKNVLKLQKFHPISPSQENFDFSPP